MNHNINNKKLVIAVSGTLCSGKGLVAQILKSKDCDIDTFSSGIRDELKSKGITEATRKQLQDEGNRLRKEHGGQILAEKLLNKYKDSSKPLVIDGLRNIGELEYLKKHSNFFLIGVDAPLEFRWDLTQKRKSDRDMLDYDNFVELDSRDKGYNEPLNGQQVGMCLTHADYLIYNDEEFKDLEESKLYKQVMEIYEDILKKI
jgi:dephospho-CoA kinase